MDQTRRNEDMKEKKKQPIDISELWAEIAKAKASGLQPSKRYGEIMMTLTSMLKCHKSYSRYPTEVKNDMEIYAWEKLIRALKTVKLGDGGMEDQKRVFNYMYRTVWNAFLTTVMKFYKQQNIKRKLFAEYLDRQEHLDARTKERLQATICWDFDPNY